MRCNDNHFSSYVHILRITLLFILTDNDRIIPKEQIVKENANAKFICAAKHVIEWMMVYNEKILYNQCIPNSERQKNEIHILRANRGNQGEYRCRGQIKDGFFYATGRLIIVCK